jgi:hypothetical protein
MDSVRARPHHRAMARLTRSVLARLSFSLGLAPLCAALFVGLGLGFGIACSPDAGSGCSPGTANCQCAGGNMCYPGLQCLAGFCVMGVGEGETGESGDGDGDNPCDNGQEFCGGKCVDTDVNILHCGGCGIACTSDQLCYEGSCATDCTEAPCEGLTWCDPDLSVCVPGCSDDFQCGANEMCDLGTHECVCGFEFELCGEECIWQGDPCADNCGNGVIDSGEACDGNALDGYTCVDFGYNGGTLACYTDCSGFDESNCSNATCGNGIVEDGEECDGVNLDGETCVSQGYSGGTLSCTSCSFNTNNCSNGSDDGNCCIPHVGPGCEVPAISQCVCGMDAFCCNTEWDDICAGIAINNCNANCP